jgi:hypothetical protein
MRVSRTHAHFARPKRRCYNYEAFVAESSSYGAILRVAQVALLPEYYNISTPQTNLTMDIQWGRASPTNVAFMSAIA